MSMLHVHSPTEEDLCGVSLTHDVGTRVLCTRRDDIRWLRPIKMPITAAYCNPASFVLQVPFTSH
jgi:hypothetical protein